MNGVFFSIQSIPRTIVFDKKTGTDVLQWPVEEVESLRKESVELDVKLGPGSIVPVAVDSASQVSDFFPQFSTGVVT